MADEDVISSGRNEKGQFVSKQVIQQAASRALSRQAAETDRARAKVDALTAAWSKQESHVKKLASIQTKAFQTQISNIAKIQKTMEKSMKGQTAATAKAMTSQVREYRRLANERIRAARSGGRGGSGGSGGGILGGLGIGSGLGTVISVAAVYAVWRKFLSSSTPFLSAEIGQRGSSAAIRAAMQGIQNVKPSAGADLLGKYQAMGKAQLFGSPQAARGLVRLQSELAKGAGVEKATELVEELAKSYGDATDSLDKFLSAAGSGNIESVLKQFASGRNIVETTRALNALSIATDLGKGKLDPMVEANLRLTQTLDTLDSKLEKIITDLTGRLLPAIEKITKTIDGMSTEKLLLLAGGAVVAPTILKGGAKLALRGIATAVGGGAAVGAGGIVAGALAVGTAGALGIDKMRDNRGKGVIGWWLEARAARARDAENDKELTRLKALKAERDKHKQQTQTATPKEKSLWQTVIEGAEKAKEAVSKYVAKMKETVATDKLAKLQAQAARQQQTKLSSEVAGSETELKRAQLDLARLSPFGQQWGLLQSIPEWKALQSTIKSEVDRLTEYLKTIDSNTEQGRIESNKIRTQIISLQSEEKKNSIELLQGMTGGYLDAVASQAMGAGRFEKFIVTSTQNKRRGLEKGLVKPNPLLGGLDKKDVIQPFQFGVSMDRNVSDFNKWSAQLETRFRNVAPKMMIPLPQMQQDALGGRMLPQTELARPEAPEAHQDGVGNVGVQTVQSSGKKVEQLKQIMGGLDQLIKLEESDLRGQRQPRSGRQSVG